MCRRRRPPAHHRWFISPTGFVAHGAGDGIEHEHASARLCDQLGLAVAIEIGVGHQLGEAEVGRFPAQRAVDAHHPQPAAAEVADAAGERRPH
jgi:hypothetical protein